MGEHQVRLESRPGLSSGSPFPPEPLLRSLATPPPGSPSGLPLWTQPSAVRPKLPEIPQAPAGGEGFICLSSRSARGLCQLRHLALPSASRGDPAECSPPGPPATDGLSGFPRGWPRSGYHPVVLHVSGC